MLRRTLKVPGPLDLTLTLAHLRHGPFDPTIALYDDEVHRATRTPDGAAAAA